MKKILFSTMLIVGSFSFVTHSQAEEASTDLSVNAEGGGISISSNDSISFPSITKRKGIQAFHPTVNQSKGFIDLFTGTSYEHVTNNWMKNPYNHELHIAPPPYLDSGKYYDARPYLIKVDDNTLGNSSWSIKVKRTPFIHDETGKELRNVQLFFGKFKDNGDIKGHDYNLAEYLTVSNEASLVASYSGESAKGEHFISPFTPPNENPDGKSLSDDVLVQGKDFTYTDKNITLGIDKQTVIPESGQYRSTLIWSLESSP